MSSPTRTIATALAPCALTIAPRLARLAPPTTAARTLRAVTGLAGVALTTTLPSIALAGTTLATTAVAGRTRAATRARSTGTIASSRAIAVAKTLAVTQALPMAKAAFATSMATRTTGPATTGTSTARSTTGRGVRRAPTPAEKGNTDRRSSGQRLNTMLINSSHSSNIGHTMAITRNS